MTDKLGNINLKWFAITTIVVTAALSLAFMPLRFSLYWFGLLFLVMIVKWRKLIVARVIAWQHFNIFAASYKWVVSLLAGIFFLTTLFRIESFSKASIPLVQTLFNLATLFDQYLFLVLIGMLFLGLYFSSANFAENSMVEAQKTPKKVGWKEWIVVVIMVLLFFAYALNGLGTFMTVDEPKWLLNRGPQLIQAVKEGEWKNTLVNDKPGVLPAAVSSIFVDYERAKDAAPEQLEKHLYFWRLPILGTVSLGALLIYFYMRKIFSAETSLLALGFILTSPVVFSISRVVNPDSLLWVGTTLSLLTFYLALKKGDRGYALGAIIFQTLALLSKFTAAINFLIFFAFILFKYLLNSGKGVTKLQADLWRFLEHIVGVVLLYGLIFPHNWETFSHIAKGTIAVGFLQTAYPLIFLVVLVLVIDLSFFQGRLLKYLKQARLGFGLEKLVGFTFISILSIAALNQFAGQALFNVSGAINSGNVNPPSLAETAFINFTILALGVPVLVLAGYLLNHARRLLANNKQATTWAAMSAAIGAVFLAYLLASGFRDTIANMRYQLMFIPFIAITAAAAIMGAVKLRAFSRVLIATCIIISVGSLIAAPFPWVYSNILNVNRIVIQQPWGFGGYEVANYLNRLPGARQSVIWVDTEGVAEFFVGKSLWRGSDNPFEVSIAPDYLVLTDRGYQVLTTPVALGGVPFYEDLVKTTPLLSYYDKEPSKKVCLDSAEKICYRIVKF